MNRNTTNDQLSSSDLHDISASSRRSSSTTSSKKVYNLPRQSSVRRGISKLNISRGSRKSSKRTPEPRRKKNELHMDVDMQTDGEDDDVHHSSLSDNHGDRQNLLNLSSASSDTVIDEDLSKKKTLEKRPIEYFIPINDSGKVKCSLCLREYKHDPVSDSNLRSHLGFQHGLYSYLYPSQVKQRKQNEKKAAILPHLKRELDSAAIKCIVKDGLPFGSFRRAGMQHFLNAIKPGYYGPSRQTVRKHLDKMYKERRSTLKEKFTKIPFISLTTDMWMNSRRHHFLVITAHYHDEHFQQFSDVISFRCFRGRHFSVRLRRFLLNEIKKMGIESKIISITTDNGSDIKSATSSYEFGIRFSCDAHNINRTVSTALSLWKRSAKNKKVLATTTTNAGTDDSEDELEELTRLVDYAVSNDKWIDCEDDHSDSDFDDDYVPKISNEEESDSSSDDSSDDNDDPSRSQLQDRQTQEDEEEREMEQLLSNCDDLKNKIFSLIKKNRSLIKMIHKSSILTAFVRNEIQRKQIALNAASDAKNEERVKINDLVIDFHIRWNSTYLMLVRLLVVQQIINDITYSSHAHIGLTPKQVKKLRSFANNHLDWELLQSLANVLAPFYLATKCLSGRKYSTLSLSYWITENLFVYLTNRTFDSRLENALKELLFHKFNLYFKTKITHEEECAKLIAAYPDPFTLQELSVEETNEAEMLIMNSVKNSSNAKRSASVTTTEIERAQQQGASSASVNSSKSSKLSTINQFRISCRSSSLDAATAPKLEVKPKALTLKQEFSLYVSTSKPMEDFQTYWNEKQSALPILSSYARRYNCIPTTSVASESAFSVAGYIDRKQRASLSTTTLRYLMLLKE